MLVARGANRLLLLAIVVTKMIEVSRPKLLRIPAYQHKAHAWLRQWKRATVTLPFSVLRPPSSHLLLPVLATRRAAHPRSLRFRLEPDQNQS